MGAARRERQGWTRRILPDPSGTATLALPRRVSTAFTSAVRASRHPLHRQGSTRRL